MILSSQQEGDNLIDQTQGFWDQKAYTFGGEGIRQSQDSPPF